jgi:hypothetical protein
MLEFKFVMLNEKCSSYHISEIISESCDFRIHKYFHYLRQISNYTTEQPNLIIANQF